VLRARLVVDNPDGMDRMTLHAECADAATAMADAIVASLRDVTKLRGEVAFVAPGSLPNDGKVIDDRRRYD
jgi:phenylacetate-CoA ligase